MSNRPRDEIKFALETVELSENAPLTAMHLSEIEEEANNVLDLLTTLRSHAYRQDVAAGQESLAELRIILQQALLRMTALCLI
jgi:hypothetical protein